MRSHAFYSFRVFVVASETFHYAFYARLRSKKPSHHFVAEDIFTGKRCDELVPAGHNLEVPVVSKAEYTLLDIDDDDHMSLMDEKGDTREDLKLPDDRSGDSAFALAQEVQKKFDEGAEVVVTIMSAMGIDQLSGWKEAAN